MPWKKRLRDKLLDEIVRIGLRALIELIVKYIPPVIMLIYSCLARSKVWLLASVIYFIIITIFLLIQKIRKPARVGSNHVFYGFGEMAPKVVEKINISNNILIVNDNTKWFYSFLISVVSARMRGANIAVVTPRRTENGERKRIGLLVRLGCRVYLEDSLAQIPKGYYFDFNDIHRSYAIIEDVSSTVGAERRFAQYDSNLDYSVLLVFRNYIKSSIQRHKYVKTLEGSFRIERIEVDEVIRRLRNIPQYAGSHIEINFCEIEINEVKCITYAILEYKLLQIERTIDSIYGPIQLFEPLTIRFANSNKHSIILPPVVEYSEKHGYVVINGNHRIFYCYRKGIEKIRCFVVRGVKDDLPGKPVPIKNVKITKEENRQASRMLDHRPQNFRKVEHIVHPANEVWLEEHELQLE